MSERAISPLMHRIAVWTAVMTAIAVPLRVSGVALEQGALGLALLGALLLWAMSTDMRLHVKQGLLTPQAKVISIIFVAWLTTIPFSFDPAGSFEIGARSGLFILACLLLWGALKADPSVHRLLWKTLIVSSIAFAVLALMSLNGVTGIIDIVKGGSVITERPRIVFKAFAAVAMCLIPVIAWAGRNLDGQWRWWGYSFAPLALAVMVQTHNRSALVGFLAMTLIGVIMLAFAYRKHAKALLATAMAGTLGIVAWVATREIQLNVKTDVANSQLTTYLPYWLLDPHRQHIWKFSFNRFLEAPWFGNGIDQLNRLPGAKMPAPGLESSAALVPSHPHNWAVEILAETGLIGFVPVILALAFIAWKLARDYLKTGNEASLALLTLMAGFWCSALFNFSIWAAWWQLTFYVLFAIISATKLASQPTPSIQN